VKASTIVARSGAGAVLVWAAAHAAAQGASDGWRPFFSVTPVWQGKAEIKDAGGDFSAWSALVRGGVSGPIGGGHRAGVTLNYDYTDYAFSGRTAFGGAPWDVVQRVGVSVPLFFRGPGDWSFGIVPSLDYFAENGADWGESLTYGAIFSATKAFAPDRRLGIGLGAFDRLERRTVFPFIAVDWRLAERWRLVNPLPAGPTGPAGLEIEYALTSDWRLGLGAAWRSQRFRLDRDGPVPNGIGEERAVPVFLRAAREFGRQSSLNLYAGVVVGGTLRVDDAGGSQLKAVDFEPQPLLGATFSMRF
jgi:hypothetical protein